MAIKYLLGSRIQLTPEQLSTLQQVIPSETVETTLLLIAYAITGDNPDLFYQYLNLEHHADEATFENVCLVFMDMFQMVSGQFEVILGPGWYHTHGLIGIDPVREGYIYSLGERKCGEQL